ncbi:MAG: hypothetical protein C4336_01860 [Armatimonadota bacterium]
METLLQWYRPLVQQVAHRYSLLCIRRQILSALRRARRMVWITFPSCPDPETEDYWANLVDSAPSVLDQLIEQEQLRELEQTLSKRLSTLEAQVLELWSQRRTYREIATLLGCSRKAVDNALTRIKRKVRRAEQG